MVFHFGSLRRGAITLYFSDIKGKSSIARRNNFVQTFALEQVAIVTIVPFVPYFYDNGKK